MATDRELADHVRGAVNVLKEALKQAQNAGITCKLGVVYGKPADEDVEAPAQIVKDITISLTKDL